MKRLHFLYLLICSGIVLSFTYSSVPTDDLIEWKKTTTLKWSDFKGKPDNSIEYKAMTYSRIGLEADFEDNTFIVDVKTYFVRNKSWTKNKESENLLRHEQVHFDIAEVIARKIRKAYSEYESTDLEETQTYLQETYNEYYGPVWDSYNQYDEDTNHGLVKEEQTRWEKKIEKELKELEKYSSSLVKIPFKGTF
jgi:hypothetical protein